jgi:NAD(P)-dependent dehydrogenase (short-subunit alcohol dehydrogenase family)
MKSIFRMVAVAFACAATFAFDAQAAAQEPTVLITGSNRGIGLELAKQYAEKGWKVIATVRDPATATDLQAIASKHKNVAVEKLDVTDSAAIEQLAAKYKGQPIDVLINNAGMLGDTEAQSLAKLDYATFEKVLHTNTYAPLKISQAFLPNVEASSQKKIVAITSGLSSITGTQRAGNLYFYRVSKSGLNMAMRVLQVETRDKGIKVGILAPGVVDTRLLRQSGYSRMPGTIEPPQSAAGLINVIENLEDENTTGFTHYDGKTIPW